MSAAIDENLVLCARSQNTNTIVSLLLPEIESDLLGVSPCWKRRSHSGHPIFSPMRWSQIKGTLDWKIGIQYTVKTKAFILGLNDSAYAAEFSLRPVQRVNS